MPVMVTSRARTSQASDQRVSSPQELQVKEREQAGAASGRFGNVTKKTDIG